MYRVYRILFNVAAVLLFAVALPLLDGTPKGHGQNPASITSPNAIDHAVGWQTVTRDAAIIDTHSTLKPAYQINSRDWRVAKRRLAVNTRRSTRDHEPEPLSRLS